jgi:tetratricopeptide (TPR) repeat protein
MKKLIELPRISEASLPTENKEARSLEFREQTQLKIFKIAVMLFVVLTLNSKLSTLNLLHAAPGKSGANYLKVDVGAKAPSMAGCQYGAEDDVFAQFYNPALLSNISRKEIGFMHNEFFEDFRQEILSYLHPTERHGNFATALNYFSYGQITGYDRSGNKTADVSASDMSFGVSWGKRSDLQIKKFMVEGIDHGATIKLLKRSLADESITNFGLDMGLGYNFKSDLFRGLRTGMVYQNLGSAELPTTLRIGAAYSFWGEAFTTTFDLVNSGGSGLHPNLAMEYRLAKIASVRVGYKGNQYLDNRFTYGIGFENPLFRLDYAFVPFGDLGDAHRISVIYKFGKNTKKPKADSLLKLKVRDAKTMYAQGELVESYLLAMQVQRVAPWMDENNKLIGLIQKEFRELEESDRREKLIAQVTALIVRGEKFFEQGNLINARLDFQAVIGLQPENKAAQGYIKQIEAQFNSFIESFYRSGMIAFAAENYEKAKEEFEKVLVINPNHEEAKTQLSRCNDILNKKVKEVEESVRQETVSKTMREALKAYKEQKYEESIPLFNAVLELNPNDEDAKRYLVLAKETAFKKYLERGKDFAAKGEWDNAIKNLKIALEHNRASTEAKSLLSDVQRRWELQKKVLSQNLYKEGLEAFLSGDKKKARDVWQKAVELDPENEEAKRGLSRIQ